MRIAPYCVALLCLLSFACTKETQEKSPDELNRVVRTATPAPNNFVHKTFKLVGYTKYEFEVPAHLISPKLQGSFKAYAAGDPEQAASVDLLLMTPEQFNEFSHGASEEVRYSVMGSSGQTVDYSLPSTIDQPQKYYLVFRNPAKGTRKTVEADFTASF
jgi:hypothetical protein